MIVRPLSAEANCVLLGNSQRSPAGLVLEVACGEDSEDICPAFRFGAKSDNRLLLFPSGG